MRVLVTGSGGFVGGHLVRFLKSCGDDVLTWDGSDGSAASPDVANGAQVASVLQALQGSEGVDIDGVYHLAGQARVDLSWSEPASTMAINAGGVANLMSGLAAVESSARVVLMSSAEVYGLVDPALLPVDENVTVAPRSPYGVSKLAAEQLGLVLGNAAGREVVVCRPFNQIGPGQRDTFVAAAFAAQVVANERAGAGVITVGNLSATRDFLDVRDAVAAYRMLMIEGQPGEIYNVAAGRELAISDLLDGLVAQSSVGQRVVIDESRMRPNDLARMFGSSDKLTSQTGWRPERSLQETLADVLDEWRGRESAKETS